MPRLDDMRGKGRKMMSKMVLIAGILLAVCVSYSSVSEAAKDGNDYGSLADGIQKVIDKAQKDAVNLRKQLDEQGKVLAKITSERDGFSAENRFLTKRVEFLEGDNKDLQKHAGRTENELNSIRKEHSKLKTSSAKHAEVVSREINEVPVLIIYR